MPPAMGLESTKSVKEKRMEEQLQELQESLSQDVQAFQDTSPEAARTRYEKCEGSTLAFGRAYMPHYFTSESAAFHIDLDAMVHARRRHVFITHGAREHAKSTIVRTGLIKRVLYGTIHYPLVVSEELKLSKGHVAYIAAELTENARIQADFNVEVQKYSENEGILQVRVTPQATGIASTARIEASSHKRGVKGSLFMQHRPDFALIDDFEDRESARSERIAAQKVEWVFQELYPACAGGTDQDEIGAPIIWLGNTTCDTSALYKAMLETVEDTTAASNPDDALRDFLRGGTDPQGGAEIPQRPDRSIEAARNGLETGVWGADESEIRELAPQSEQNDKDGDTADVGAAKSIYCYRATTQIESTGNTVYLWPERYERAWYERMRRTMGPSRFDAEMNGFPVVVGVFFEPKWFPTYDELPDEVERGYMWCDPAFGESQNAAYKAVVAVATDRHRYHVLDAWLRQQEGTRAMIEAMYVLYERWDLIRHGGYEGTFKQDDRLAQDFQDAAQSRGYPLPVSAHDNLSNKDARIESMEPLASNDRIQWPSKARRHKVNWDDVDRLKGQMLSWPQGAYDDGPDALESCIARCRLGGATSGIEYESLKERRYGRRR